MEQPQPGAAVARLKLAPLPQATFFRRSAAVQSSDVLSSRCLYQTTSVRSPNKNGTAKPNNLRVLAYACYAKNPMNRFTADSVAISQSAVMLLKG